MKMGIQSRRPLLTWVGSGFAARAASASAFS